MIDEYKTICSQLSAKLEKAQKRLSALSPPGDEGENSGEEVNVAMLAEDGPKSLEDLDKANDRIR